jgi:hypothetical protein
MGHRAWSIEQQKIADCGFRIAELKTNDLNGFNGLNVLRSNTLCALRLALCGERTAPKEA